MKTAMIVLHDEEFTIQELKSRKLSGWLGQLEGPLVAAMGLVAEAMDTDVDAPDALQGLVSRVADLVSSSVDQVLDLMIAFAPDLKDEIDACWTSEIVPAFVEVLKLAVPFDLKKVKLDQVLNRIGELKEIGSSVSSTSTSSPGPSGGSGPTTSEETEAA